MVPYTVINTGMLPHQYSAFVEGAFGPVHSEFDRTPEAATITTNGDGSPTPTPTPTPTPLE